MNEKLNYNQALVINYNSLSETGTRLIWGRYCLVWDRNMYVGLRQEFVGLRPSLIRSETQIRLVSDQN